jgi:hypothetical protein
MKKLDLILVALLSLSLFLSSAATKGRTSRNGIASKQTLPPTRNSANFPPANTPVSLHAQGRGTPLLNLSDGHDLITEYVGAGKREVLESHAAQPLALATGDFDEDGVPDLISGFAVNVIAGTLGVPPASGSGLLTLHRGSVDAIYPNTPEAEQRKVTGRFSGAQFLSPAQVFEAPATPSFLGAGDFDADGHYDVVMATRGNSKLYWMAGDGRGGFGPAQEIELLGSVTALTTGEINRSDGLADIVVGIARTTDTHDTAQALVFEGPEGALKHEPEVIPLPAAATSLALGQLDEGSEMDLAAAAGTDLVIVHGRDRCLSLDQEERSRVLRAKVEHRPMAFSIASLSIGDFSGDYLSEVALLGDDGVVHILEPDNASKKWGKIVGEVTTGTSSTDFSLCSPGQSQTEVCATQTLIRARVSVSGKDDLLVIDRAAHQVLVIANDAALSTKVRESPFSASPSLRVAASLAIEGEPVAVLPMRLNKDALSDLVVLKNGGEPVAVAATVPAAIITVNTSADNNGASVRDNVLTLSEAISVANGNLKKSDLTPAEQAQVAGTPATPGLDEIRFSVNTINQLGGGFGGAGGFPSITDTLTIDGTIGGSRVELNGLTTVNTRGLSVTGSNIVIRGLVINGFSQGIQFFGDGGNNGSGDILEGSYIGTDKNGTAKTGCPASPSCSNGVSIGNSGSGTFATNVLIGGTVATARNVISGYSVGIRIDSLANGNRIQGNYIGTDASGGVSLGNGTGVARNSGGAASNNTIGGTDPGARNVISGNTGNGIDFDSVTSALIQGNYIGTNAGGTAALANTQRGIQINSNSNTIGGTTAAARNVISGNGSFGGIFVSGAANNLIQGNYIGVNGNNTGALGNVGAGITFGGAANNNLVGSADLVGAGNIIANNTDGVAITSGNGNGIRRNSIFSIKQGFKAISLQTATSNNNAKAPVLTLAGNGTVTGTLNSTASTTFTIEFFQNNTCDPNKEGEARDPLSSLAVTTNSSGAATFNAPTGTNLTATATDPSNNTSQVSRCVASVAPPTITLNTTQLTFNANDGGSNPTNQTVTLTNTGGGTLNWQIAATSKGLSNEPANWLSVTASSGNSGTLAPNESTMLTVSVNISALSGSSTPYQGTIAVSSANAGNSPQNVAVNLTVNPVDSIAIVDPTVDGRPLDQFRIPETGDTVFSCAIQYQLSSDPLAGSIVLEAYDLAGNPLTPFARIAEPVARTTQPKTKNIKFLFRIPAFTLESHVPRVRITAVLSDSALPTPRRLKEQSVEFSARNWILLLNAKANGAQAYPVDDSPRLSDDMVTLEINATYLLSGPEVGEIWVVVTDGVLTSSEKTVIEKAFPVTATGASEKPFSQTFSFESKRGFYGLRVEVLLFPRTGSDPFSDVRLAERNFTFHPVPVSKGDYRFLNTRNGAPNNSNGPTNLSLSNTEGASGDSPNATPALTDLINPGTATANSFATDTIDGASTTALKFPYNNGLALSPTTDVVSNNSYSIVMLLKFDEANKRRRILDLKNGTSDNGLYAEADNNLRFAPAVSGSGGPITANKYVQVAITRDTSAVVTGYVNGTQQFQFTDTNSDAVIDSTNTLRFFQDNLSGGNTGEASEGSIARLRLYGFAMDSTAIAGLDRGPSEVQFSAANYSVSEGAGFATITVTRTGATTLPATVNYITNDETAKQKSDYTFAAGTLSFAAGETSKTFQVLVTDNSLVDLDRNVSLFLTDPNGVALSTQSVAVLTITDNETGPSTTNPVDQARFFVQQHYYDFLSRYPDQGGWDFWTNNINNCTPQPSCTELQRINTSAAYFLSIEFQQTGYLVERIYKAAYGDASGTSTFGGAHQLSVPVVRYTEFLTDTQQIGKGVVVGQTGWEQVLESNKQNFAAQFVQRTRFATALATTLTPAQFVDKLFANAGVTPSSTDRNAAIAEFGSATNTSDAAARGRALRDLSENSILNQQEFNRAFVLMQFFGYLRRNPNDLPDSDYTGYDFWLTKLNQFNGNFVAAEMVKAFITSTEYRNRFGP